MICASDVSMALLIPELVHPTAAPPSRRGLIAWVIGQQTKYCAT